MNLGRWERRALYACATAFVALVTFYAVWTALN